MVGWSTWARAHQITSTLNPPLSLPSPPTTPPVIRRFRLFACVYFGFSSPPCILCLFFRCDNWFWVYGAESKKRSVVFSVLMFQNSCVARHLPFYSTHSYATNCKSWVLRSNVSLSQVLQEQINRGNRRKVGAILNKIGNHWIFSTPSKLASLGKVLPANVMQLCSYNYSHRTYCCSYDFCFSGNSGRMKRMNW